MHRLNLAIVILAGLPTLAIADEDLPDRFIYEGEKHDIFSKPLEAYFNDGHKRPEELRSSNGHWRGYVATWTINQDYLYLESIEGEDGGSKTASRPIPISTVFKGQVRPLKASWYTGMLRVPLGKALRPGNIAFHEKELGFVVRDGNVISKRLIDNTGNDATRSPKDIEWVELGGAPVPDDGKWHDARTIDSQELDNLRQSGERFMTRGILADTGNIVIGGAFTQDRKRSRASLYIYPTPTSGFVRIRLSDVPKGHGQFDGTHVEIGVRFVNDGDNFLLHADSIRALNPGESIHHTNFEPVVPSKDDEELLVAAFQLDVGRVRLLLAAGANPNVRLPHFDRKRFEDKWTPGSYSIGSDRWTPLLAVSNSVREPQPTRVPENTPAARMAADRERMAIDPRLVRERDKRRASIAKLLIAADADLNLEDGYGATALYCALSNGYDELAMLLIEANARLDTKTDVYIDGPGDTSPIHYAAHKPTILAAMIKRGAKVNVSDTDGRTPLSTAVLGTDIECVELLLSAGADVDAKDLEALTAAYRGFRSDLGLAISDTPRDAARRQILKLLESATHKQASEKHPACRE